MIPNIFNGKLVVDQIGQRGRGREEASVIEHGAQATPESVTDVRALGTTSDAYPGQPGNPRVSRPNKHIISCSTRVNRRPPRPKAIAEKEEANA